MIAKQEDIDVAAVEAIEAVLTDRQRRRYRAMIGEPFDFAATTKWPPPAPPVRPAPPEEQKAPGPGTGSDDPASKPTSKPPG